MTLLCHHFLTFFSISPINYYRGRDYSDKHCNDTAFDARKAKYIIFIEGKWSAHSESRELRERKKVSEWVHKVVNQLNKCEGIQSTAHPESVRDQISKSGNSKPPLGYYNFSYKKGIELLHIKKKRDPKNIFSLASRVSFLNKT